MTIAEIKAHRIEPDGLFRSINTTSLSDAVAEPLTLEMLKYDESRKDDPSAMRDKDYVFNFVNYAIYKICSAYKRRDSMGEEERKDLAGIIIRRFSFLTIADIKLFSDMVIAGDITTYSLGKEETRLVTVDSPAIIEKLKAYLCKRDKFLPKRQAIAPKPISSPDGKTYTPIFHTLGEWEKTHDFYGNKVDGDWNPWEYWDKVKLTHIYDHGHYIPAPEGLDTIKWWNSIPTPEEIEQRYPNAAKRMAV